jgi:hypothetical protein
MIVLDAIEVRSVFHAMNTDLVVILAGMTSQLQALDAVAD